MHRYRHTFVDLSLCRIGNALVHLVVDGGRLVSGNILRRPQWRQPYFWGTEELLSFVPSPSSPSIKESTSLLSTLSFSSSLSVSSSEESILLSSPLFSSSLDSIWDNRRLLHLNLSIADSAAWGIWVAPSAADFLHDTHGTLPFSHFPLEQWPIFPRRHRQGTPFSSYPFL